MLINDLPTDLREMALKEIEDQRSRGLIKEGWTGRSLDDTFYWHKSKNGYDFWKDASDRLEVERWGKDKRLFFGSYGSLRNGTSGEAAV